MFSDGNPVLLQGHQEVKLLPCQPWRQLFILPDTLDCFVWLPAALLLTDSGYRQVSLACEVTRMYCQC